MLPPNLEKPAPKRWPFGFRRRTHSCPHHALKHTAIRRADALPHIAMFNDSTPLNNAEILLTSGLDKMYKRLPDRIKNLLAPQ
jgi:hypothetical protein